MKKIQIKAFSKDEAIAKITELGFNVLGDATIKYNEESKGKIVDEAFMNKFAKSYLDKKHKVASHSNGYIIVMEAGVKDTRLRPYSINNVKNEQGKRTYQTSFLLKDMENSTLLDIVVGTKKEAEERAKELYSMDGFTGSIECRRIKTVKEGESRDFTIEYAPSKNTKIGNYLFFGFENREA